ncbi:MAG: hypothetical protein OEO82_07630 [Gammaproteobacteria bacterium]|nr:hypothetical protein [Gammaproteobacteria bacterium]
MMHRAARQLLVLALMLSLALTANADSHGPADDQLIVTYRAEFFSRYRPNTALDMVDQVPGFQLDNGEDERGFGNAVGNILINDRYPSAKQDTPSQILQRIPAAQVERIELIRGQVREIDLLGRPVVVNLVLAEDTPAAIRWELAVRKNFSLTPLAPIGGISIADRWGDTTYNFGVDARRSSYGDPGSRVIVDATGALTETRFEDDEGSGFDANAYLTAARDFGATSVNFNSTVNFEHRDQDTLTQIVPADPAGLATSDSLLRQRRNRRFEIGLNAERGLSADLTGKAVLLYFQLDEEPLSLQRRFDANGDETLFREADTEAKATESIARLEFVWTRYGNHVIQFNVEGANNVLDSVLVQTVDTGTGPEIVPVPGANSRVEEDRADVLLTDTWSFADFKFEYGLGWETSTISQTGDATQERSFSFLKPRATLTYAPSPQRQTRLTAWRRVAQLDFNDFVSATVFEDDDLALGNPDLKPESTWILQFSEERRFGEVGAVKLFLFHHWISDVEDLLPLTAEFEAPGNIGDGRRWGVEIEGTLPLDRFGLKGAKLDAKVRWQDSTVPDPVTGNDRVLSAQGGIEDEIGFRDDNEYSYIFGFRQDFEAARVAWGWDYSTRAERPLFKVNELEVFDEGVLLSAFVETTRWFGIKIGLKAENILDIVDARDRTIYVGERELTPVESEELRRLTNGRRITLSLSGAF